MTRKKHGGKRRLSGRKEIADKKVLVALYINQSVIDVFNGQVFIKNWLYNSIDMELESLK